MHQILIIIKNKMVKTRTFKIIKLKGNPQLYNKIKMISKKIKP